MAEAKPQPANNPWQRLALALALIGALALAAWGPLDEAAEASTSTALERALVTYASARGLNGIISVLQGTEIALQPAGIGVTLTAGEILDPLNDLVERFAGILLLAAASLGLQLLVTQLLATPWLALALAPPVAYGLWLLWRNRHWPHWLTRLLVAGFLLRFLVSLACLSSQWLAALALEPMRAEAAETLGETRSALETVEQGLDHQPDPEDGLFAGARRFVDNKLTALDLRARIAGLEQQAEQAVRAVVRLIALFMLQTVLLPLAAAWLLLRIARLAWPAP